jgi:hypothetical protein
MGMVRLLSTCILKCCDQHGAATRFRAIERNPLTVHDPLRVTFCDYALSVPLDRACYEIAHAGDRTTHVSGGG